MIDVKTDMRNITQIGRFMSLGRSLALCMVLGSAALTAVPSAASAQTNQVTDSQTVGSWSVRCYRAGPIACDMTQIDVDRTRNVLVASVSISYDPKSDVYLGRFLLPLGVSFDQGMTLEIGGFIAQNIKFRVCGRDGCLVMNPLPLQLIQAMQAGGSTKGAMRAAYIDGRKFEIPILLNGFSEGLDILKKKTAEKLAAADKK
jgi:invasion protein IalB